MRPLPSLSLLNELFYIEGGLLLWRKDPPRKKNFVGREVGTPSTGGYRIVKIKGVKYLTHRIMYYMYTGEDPVGYEIDHVDGNPANNQKGNLRIATHAQNCQNKKVSGRNTSGHQGVTYRTARKKWSAYIRLNGEPMHLGYFDNKEDAVKTYIAACNEHFGEYSPWADGRPPEFG